MTAADVSHRHLPMPHRRSHHQAFGRIDDRVGVDAVVAVEVANSTGLAELLDAERLGAVAAHAAEPDRSEEHTSELQSRVDLVCRLLLEKKKKTTGASA